MALLKLKISLIKIVAIKDLNLMGSPATLKHFPYLLVKKEKRKAHFMEANLASPSSNT